MLIKGRTTSPVVVTHSEQGPPQQPRTPQANRVGTFSQLSRWHKIRHHRSSPSTLFETGSLVCHCITYTRLNGLWASGSSPVSTPHLAIGAMRLWMGITMSGFMWIQGTWTQVLMLLWQALCSLNYVCSPHFTFKRFKITFYVCICVCWEKS